MFQAKRGKANGLSWAENPLPDFIRRGADAIAFPD
jgi:hypothetical protein